MLNTIDMIHLNLGMNGTTLRELINVIGLWDGWELLYETI